MGSFTGPVNLYKVVKQDGKYNISLSQIKKWMSTQDGYALHRTARRNFKRNRVIVPTIDAEWDSDLADLSSVSRFNDGYHFILIVVDIFSRFAFTKPLRSKKSI